MSTSFSMELSHLAGETDKINTKPKKGPWGVGRGQCHRALLADCLPS